MQIQVSLKISKLFCLPSSTTVPYTIADPFGVIALQNVFPAPNASYARFALAPAARRTPPGSRAFSSSATATVSKPKTKCSKRTVALGDLAVAALREHQGSADATSAAFVFATATGGHPSRAVLRQRYFLPTCERAKIDGLTMHGLRHTMTSLALAEGGPIAAVSARLGHTTTRMTLDRYGHVLPGQDRGIAVALDSALKKKRSTRDRVKNRV